MDSNIARPISRDGVYLAGCPLSTKILEDLKKKKSSNFCSSPLVQPCRIGYNLPIGATSDHRFLHKETQ